MLGFSYQHAKEEAPRRQWSDSEWKKEYEYRSALIALQKENRSLKQQLVKKQDELAAWEKKLAEKQSNEAGLATWRRAPPPAARRAVRSFPQ